MSHDDEPPARRRFLMQGAAAAAGVLAGGRARANEAAPPGIPEWMKVPGADVGSQTYGLPSRFEGGVIRNVPKGLTQHTSASSRTPLQDLDGILTPNGLFYERHHGGIPDIDPARHRLMIHGLVETPLILTLDDIRRFPSESHIYFLECSGNPGFEAIKGRTASDLVGLVSCAEWTGVRLATILAEAGLKPEAKWVVAEGADSAAMTRSIPIAKCLDDALLVYSQNGERLRPQQGYPLRVFLPGFEGNMSVKWLRRLNVTAEPAYSREETSKYTDLMPDGTARQFTFDMEPKSLITRPSGGDALAGAGLYQMTGIAWSGRGTITTVEITVDSGATWTRAELQTPVFPRAHTRFHFPWKWDGREAVIASRCTDDTGYTQPTLAELIAVRGVNSQYHNNGIQAWKVAADGKITNGNHA
jgi:sulfane dehydrogenase subunit SoxC